MNHRLLRAWPVDGVAPIDQQVIGLDGKLIHGGAHGEQRSLADIDAVDRLHIDGGDGKRQCLGADDYVEFVALVFAELLRIIETREPAAQGQNDGRSHHRPEHRPPAHLVASRNLQKAAFRRSLLQLPTAYRHVPSIRTIYFR